jgi:hypothetical protein
MGLKDLSIPKFAYHLPWFMFDIDNVQLITTGSDIIPSDIKDTKEIVLTEVPIPGLNFSPILPGGAGNRKISFTIPLIKRNNTVGNVLILKQFENLRNNAVGLTGLFSEQFDTTPRVLYSWGIGSVPLVFWVKKCDATHKQGWTNEMGFPQYSELDIELWLDETNLLYKAEEVFRKLASLAGMVYGAYGIVKSTEGKRVY